MPGGSYSLDGHDDLAIFVRFMYNSHIYSDEFKKDFVQGGMKAHVDLPRLKKGKMGGAFWAAFVPCPAKGLDFSDENYAPCRFPASFRHEIGLLVVVFQKICIEMRAHN